MTTKTTLRQNCTSTYDALGTTKFQVENTLTYLVQGDLPQASIFVYQLGTPTDPKSDTFLRIGSIQDITNTVIGRDNAISTGALTYLSTGFTVLYADVSTATAAKQLIQSRVDQLIIDWHLYTEAFTSPDLTEFPLQDAGLVAAKKSAYASAKAAKAAADAAVVALAADLTVKQAAADTAAANQVHLQADSADCVTLKTALTPIQLAEVAFKNASSDFLAAARMMPVPALASSTANALTAATAAYDYVQAAATLFTGQLSDALLNLHAPLETLAVTTVPGLCLTRAGAASGAASTAAIANAAIGAAQRAAILAQQTATTAQTTLETALSEAMAVCPTFDPSTV